VVVVSAVAGVDADADAGGAPAREAWRLRRNLRRATGSSRDRGYEACGRVAVVERRQDVATVRRETRAMFQDGLLVRVWFSPSV
jgi:hypothetical protein